jgi:hypothetical protein
MATPERKVKAKVKKVLAKYPESYSYWPVPAGYGASTLDCLVCHYGWWIAIETKAPGKKPTPRQHQTIGEIERANGITFVIDGRPEQLAELEDILERIKCNASTYKLKT